MEVQYKSFITAQVKGKEVNEGKCSWNGEKWMEVRAIWQVGYTGNSHISTNCDSMIQKISL